MTLSKESEQLLLSNAFRRDGTPMETLDEYINAWEREDRRVRQDIISSTLAEGGEEVRVSTVWLVIDHSYYDGEPLIYETMIFEGPHDGDCWRYTSEELAIMGHDRVVDCLRRRVDP